MRDELRGWYGIEEVDIDGRQVAVRLNSRHPHAGELVDSLRGSGSTRWCEPTVAGALSRQNPDRCASVQSD